jgi:predicted MPP superfamily phosphohydrolase
MQKAMTRAHETTCKVISTVSSLTDPLNGTVEVTKVHLPLPRLSAAFHSYRLVQISDLHQDAEIPDDYLDRVVALVNQQQPDVIVITGDFVTGEAERYAESLTRSLRRLEAVDGVVAVLGNHDHEPWSNPKVMRAVLRESGIEELSNAIYTLDCDGELLHIAGVDDVCRGFDRLDVVLNALPQEGAAILLCHVPDFADVSAQSRRFDLQLSGHTHGGQVYLPPLGAPVLPKFGRKYPAGLYTIRQMHLYTNRGLGHPYVRLNCRPEITVFNLLSPNR